MTPEAPIGTPDIDDDLVTYDFSDYPPLDHTPEPPKRDRWATILSIAGGVLIGTGLTFAVLGATGTFTEPTSPTLPPPPSLTVPPATVAPPELAEGASPIDVASRAIPSIVTVEISSLLFDAGGSGVVYGDDGYIVTNNHVIQGAGDIVVVFSDGARYPALLVGADPLTDLAVLKVDRSDLTTIDIGTSTGLAIGQSAVAVGNPLSLVGGPSVTSGIVSAINRALDVEPGTRLYGLIQTDAPITRGSSGGALLDGNARLIGITTAIAVSDVGAEGLGFAVPIDMAVGVIADLIEQGEVNHALLGIRGDTVFAERDGAEYPVGVGVSGILDNSAYEMAGGQINDVITQVDGVTVTTQDELLTRIRFYRADDEVPLTVLRGSSTIELVPIMGRLQQ
ncbi:MAG TPA: trypsin-like peptidase domain-containing protein [Acidimicrobiia bacterium]